MLVLHQTLEIKSCTTLITAMHGSLHNLNANRHACFESTDLGSNILNIKYIWFNELSNKDSFICFKKLVEIITDKYRNCVATTISTCVFSPSWPRAPMCSQPNDISSHTGLLNEFCSAQYLTHICVAVHNILCNCALATPWVF